MELEDPCKATRQYLSAVNGEKSWKMLSEEEKAASLSIRTTSDPSESGFTTMTQVLSQFGSINMLSACRMGQSCYNGEMK